MNQKGIMVLDAETGEEVVEIANSKHQPVYLAFSKDGKRLATGGYSKSSEVTVFDTETWEKLHVRDRSEGHRKSLALSEDGAKLLVGLADCRMEIWDFAKMGK